MFWPELLRRQQLTCKGSVHDITPACCRHANATTAVTPAPSDVDISSDDGKSPVSTPQLPNNAGLPVQTPGTDSTEVWHELEVELLTPSDYLPRHTQRDAEDVETPQRPPPDFSSTMGAGNIIAHFTDRTPAQGKQVTQQQPGRSAAVNLITPSTVASTIAKPCFSDSSDVVDLTQT